MQLFAELTTTVLAFRQTQGTEIPRVGLRQMVRRGDAPLKHACIDRAPFGEGRIDFRDQEPRAFDTAELDERMPGTVIAHLLAQRRMKHRHVFVAEPIQRATTALENRHVAGTMHRFAVLGGRPLHQPAGLPVLEPRVDVLRDHLRKTLFFARRSRRIRELRRPPHRDRVLHAGLLFPAGRTRAVR
ncbi:hypothetical protein WT83_30445 [Burkholderia territorii]|uniref:Uncharacterized protein n=1 Tax=Burkholderia territorii TaxID=1503055 RepID=A0A119VD11_9BURK|nr:hypothetical protein WT83_30445 [Burkholderia territorii]